MAQLTAVSPLTNSGTSKRIDSIDLLRGLVMIIMALDHTRDFIHREAFLDDPLNMATTTPLLFMTRWITHFCAPVFVFLSGISIYLQSLRKSKKELSWFLITRGLWLIVVELVIMSFAFSFDIGFNSIFLQTIWAIGISMTLLGLLIWLPYTAVLLTGIIIVFGHNLLDYYERGRQEFSFFYDLVHRQSFHPFGNGRVLGVLYPFLPWTGLMCLGYAFGKIYTSYEGAQRKKILIWLGTGIILLFIILRATNSYGDSLHWSQQKNNLFTIFSFINTVKYPPSLLFMCMTIGPAILFLAFLGNTRSWLGRVITVFGRVPFFYYVLHFYLLHVISALLYFSRGHSFEEGAKGVPGFPFKFVMPGEGYSLGITYLVWICVIILLYPLCKWFSNYKRSHTQRWLSYV